MLKKILLTSLVAGATLYASASYVPHLENELEKNTRYIQEYERVIEQLKERNEFLKVQKQKNPELYEKKALFEETKEAYIQRVKLGGAEAKNVNFKIEKHILSLQMSIKITKDDENGYFQSSRSFFQEYSIPKDVEESKITHTVEGDYFVVTMPKKAQ